MFDFGIAFDGINADALMEIWPSIEGKPFAEFGVRLNDDDYPESDDTTANMLMLLKLLAPPKVQYTKLMESFVIFCEVCVYHVFMENETYFPKRLVLFDKLILICVRSLEFKDPNQDVGCLTDKNNDSAYIIAQLSQLDCTKIKYYIVAAHQFISVKSEDQKNMLTFFY